MKIILVSATSVRQERGSHVGLIVDRIANVWCKDHEVVLVGSSSIYYQSPAVMKHFCINGSGFSYLLRCTMTVFRLCLDERCIVMNLSNHVKCLPFFLASRIIGSNNIQRVSGFGVREDNNGLIRQFRSRLGMILEWLSCVLAHKIVCLSDALAEAPIIKNFREKIEVIPPGVDEGLIGPWKHPHERSIDAIFVGRLDPVKRIDKVLSVMRKIVELKPNARLVVIGDGVDSVLIQNSDLEIKWYQHLSHNEVFTKIADAKMLLLMSDREGLGNVALEAILSGSLVFGSQLPTLGLLKEKFGRCVLDNSSDFAMLEKALQSATAHSEAEQKKIVINLINEFGVEAAKRAFDSRVLVKCGIINDKIT